MVARVTDFDHEAIRQLSLNIYSPANGVGVQRTGIVYVEALAHKCAKSERGSGRQRDTLRERIRQSGRRPQTSGRARSQDRSLRAETSLIDARSPNGKHEDTSAAPQHGFPARTGGSPCEPE